MEVETADEVEAATARLYGLGLFAQVEQDTTCRYARQDEVLVHGPGNEPGEVYAVKQDSLDSGTDSPITSRPRGSPGHSD